MNQPQAPEQDQLKPLPLRRLYDVVLWAANDEFWLVLVLAFVLLVLRALLSAANRAMVRGWPERMRSTS